MSTEFKNDSKVYDKHIYDMGSVMKKLGEIVNCTFLVDMTHIFYHF